LEQPTLLWNSFTSQERQSFAEDEELLARLGDLCWRSVWKEGKQMVCGNFYLAVFLASE